MIQKLVIATMPTGEVISYDPDDGEGVIQPDGEDDEIPFDADSLVDPEAQDRLYVGDWVRFSVEGGMTGLMGTNVERIDD